MIELSIIVPVFCGEQTVVPLFDAIKKALEGHYSFRVIFVDDNGPDDSSRVLETLQSKYPNLIEVINLSRNFGQHNAIICGFGRATGDLVVTIDEDLQHDPADITRLVVKQQEQDYDVVYGDYDSDRKHSGFRNWTSRAMKYMLAKAIPDLHPKYSAFRVIRMPIAKAMTEMRNSYTFLDGYISWITCNIASVPVLHNEREGGVSGYSTARLIEHAINVFVTFSNYPIRLLVRGSFCVFFVTLAFSAYVITRKLLAPEFFAMGYPSLMITSGLGSGLVLLGLGIVGEYLHRVNQKTTGRPNFFIKEASNKTSD